MKKRWWILLILGIFVIYLISFLAVKGFTSQIAVVRVTGTISSSREIVDWVNMAAQNPQIKGLLLIVNSPGGGIVPSDEIYQSLLKFKKSGKPSVAYLSTVAASGGYYVACASDYIVSHPMCITGSIGTIIEYPVVKDLMDKLGVEFVVIKSGNVKDISSPFKKMTPEEQKILGNIVKQGYERFVDVVVNSRNIPRDSVLKIADGRIITGQDAHILGLVDTTGTLETAREILKKRAKIKGPVQWIEKRRMPYFMRFLNPEDAIELQVGIKFDYRIALP
jgi:protease-4